MSWLLALLYLVSGIVLGFGLAFVGLVRTFVNAQSRLFFFKKIVSFYPEDIERAQSHVSAIRPLNAMSFDAIEFGVCEFCGLPWPLHRDEAGLFQELPEHPTVSFNKADQGPCPGSHTTRFEKC